MKEENKVIGILVLCGALLSIVALTITNDLEEPKTSPEESGAVFIWNDDLEGIPANGHIEIDTIINDTIYLSPVE
jgi:uncharacterized metal-binding protein YceD (DUF177 family)